MATKVPEAQVSTSKRPNEKGAASQHAGNKEDSPKMPHERDESSFDKTRDKPHGVIKQAFDDIEAGQLDTDRRGIPGVEEVTRDKPDNAQEDIPASSRTPPSTPKK
jgi:hypothetical protein